MSVNPTAKAASVPTASVPTGSDDIKNCPYIFCDKTSEIVKDSQSKFIYFDLKFIEKYALKEVPTQQITANLNLNQLDQILQLTHEQLASSNQQVYDEEKHKLLRGVLI